MSDELKALLLMASMAANVLGLCMIYRYAYRLGREEADMDTVNAIGRFLDAKGYVRGHCDDWLRGYIEATMDIHDSLKGDRR